MEGSLWIWKMDSLGEEEVLLPSREIRWRLRAAAQGGRGSRPEGGPSGRRGHARGWVRRGPDLVLAEVQKCVSEKHRVGASPVVRQRQEEGG